MSNLPGYVAFINYHHAMPEGLPKEMDTRWKALFEAARDEIANMIEGMSDEELSPHMVWKHEPSLQIKYMRSRCRDANCAELFIFALTLIEV